MQNRVYFTKSLQIGSEPINIKTLVQKLRAAHRDYQENRCKVIISENSDMIMFVQLEENYYFLKIGYALKDTEHMRDIDSEKMHSLFKHCNAGRETELRHLSFYPLSH